MHITFCKLKGFTISEIVGTCGIDNMPYENSLIENSLMSNGDGRQSGYGLYRNGDGSCSQVHYDGDGCGPTFLIIDGRLFNNIFVAEEPNA